MAQPEAQKPTPIFRLHVAVGLEENADTEFKEVTSQNPAKTIVSAVDEYVVSFLNSSGGRIFWGIRDSDRVVVGVLLNAKDRDEVRKGVANKVHDIQPALDPTRYKLEFHPVSGGSSSHELWVVEVTVEDFRATEPYFTSSGDAFVRLNGVKQKLKGPKLTAWIKKSPKRGQALGLGE